MASLPTGTITFLFTDIEGSTKLWDAHSALMRPSLERHDALLRSAIASAGGVVFKTVGDAFCAAFASAPSALEAATMAQTALLGELWPEQTPLRVRMALHTGTVEERDNDYFGPPVNRVARLLAAGHGGQTLVSASTFELVRDHVSAGAALLDLGLHRLKDLERPEHVFQLSYPELPDTFAPLKSLDNPELPNNLPLQVTSFLGRETVLADVTALLSKTRLLTLTGAGGSGKTRLSLQSAAEVLEGYPDGVWLVEFAPLADSALVPQTVAQVLNSKEQTGQTLTQTLAENLKTKRLLLLLDNCEHVLSACANLAAALLRGCPGVRILATSREPLGIAGETTYRVPSLSLPTAKQAIMATVESLSQFEAARLFIERAQAVKPNFAVTNANAPALAQLCYRLDGIPLALELAAARARSLSVEDINTRLDNRFRLLVGGDRAALPRQQTLQTAVNWSYDLLRETEKALFNRLSVFAGGWTMEAAEAVCGFAPLEAFEVLDVLTSLVDKSLVIADEPDEGGTTRYRMLETLKQYAEERLKSGGEVTALRNKHLAWCIAFATEARQYLWGAEQARWMTRLEVEHDNFRAALTWATSGAADAADGRALQLASNLTRFWATTGYWSEARVQLATALASDDGQPATKARAEALEWSGYFAGFQGDEEFAVPCLEQAVVVSRKIGDGFIEANCTKALGDNKRGLSDWEAARALYERSRLLYRGTGKRFGEAITLSALASIEHENLEAARTLLEQALAIRRELDHPQEVAWALTDLGNVTVQQGDWQAARDCYDAALAINLKIGVRAGQVNCFCGLGDVKRLQGDQAAARSFYEQALVIARELASKPMEDRVLNGLEQLDREITVR